MINYKKGDIVIITDPFSDKNGLSGQIETFLSNGVVIKLGNNHYTAVRFNHLKMAFPRDINGKDETPYGGGG